VKARKLIAHPIDPGLVLVPLTKGYFAVISAVDADEVGKWNWHVMIAKNGPYASGRPGGGKSQTSLHRFIGSMSGLSMKDEVDHVNRNGLDCRRSNLRDATRAQQTYNASIRRDNVSGLKGVSREHGKWRARIRIDGRLIYLGSFSSPEEAHASYVAAATAARGEFACH
jgi:hypothetical protein